MALYQCGQTIYGRRDVVKRLLNVIKILSGSEDNPATYPWWNLQFGDMLAVRTALSERLAFTTVNSHLRHGAQDSQALLAALPDGRRRLLPSGQHREHSRQAVTERTLCRTVKRLQRQIAAHKLVMLKKYNVQAMLKMVGVKSGKVLTLAVFHPRYGKVIFANDKNATSAAPLRMSVEERSGKVIVGYIRPSAVFANFKVPGSFKKELDGLFESIVKKATQ